MFNSFDFINISKFARWAGINAGLMRQINRATPNISEAQCEKSSMHSHHRLRIIFLFTVIAFV